MSGDPLHDVSGPGVAWTRVNIAEGIPGVCTPLNWSWWGPANERMIRGAYYDLGVLGAVEIPPPEDVDRRTSGIFYGRPALNVDVSRGWADRQPGTSGDALEEHYFGAVRPDVQSRKSRSRYPAFFVKGAGQWVVLPRRLERLYADARRFWQRSAIDAPAETLEDARRDFERARAHFDATARPHSALALLAGALVQQIGNLAAHAGEPEALLEALGGYASIDLQTTGDLVAVSRGRLGMDAFLRRHGYQGPLQGEFSSRSWREDPGPLHKLIDSLTGGTDAPDASGADGLGDGTDVDPGERAAATRAAAERRIVAGLRGPRRLAARALLAEARRMMPAREVGKATMVMAMDAARAALRRWGRELERSGALAEAEDVFYLTCDELETGDLVDARERVAARREQRRRYAELDLPESWVGNPEPLAPDAAGAGEPLTGLGVSPGVAEGRVRILLDPARGQNLEPGDILVCEATDPSYASYFLVAGGVVTDIGGALGHGAIVAREVGIPCVVNTRHATRRLKEGERIRIDGATGRIDRLEPAGSDPRETGA